jgi:hypothetical protein
MLKRILFGLLILIMTVPSVALADRRGGFGRHERHERFEHRGRFFILPPPPPFFFDPDPYPYRDRWVPGHYEYDQWGHQYWVPGHYERY